jgi:peroxiredoxin
MDRHTPLEQTYEESFVIRRWLWSTLVGLVLIVGGIWLVMSRTPIGGGSAANSDAVSSEPAAVAGHPAPDFELKNLAGESIRLSDYQGTPVIVNFWATWCPPCRAEFPDFQKVSVEQGDKLVIIGVNYTASDSPELVPGFVDEFGITFPIVLDETGETVKTYRVVGLPTTVFIDRNGIIQEVFTGPINKAYIEGKLAEL